MTQNPEKDRPDRYERGETQKTIIRYLCNFDEGVSEPELRQFLKDELDLSAPKNIKLHLEKLENMGLIKKKMQKGRSNLWILNFEEDIKLSRYLLDNFFLNRDFVRLCTEGRDDAFELLATKGVQRIVSEIKDLSTVNLWLFEFILEAHGSHPPEKPDNVCRYEFNWDHSPEEMDELLHMVKFTASISPTFFCCLFEPIYEVRTRFWLDFDETLLERFPGDTIYPILLYHYMMSAILVDNERLKGPRAHKFFKTVGTFFSEANKLESAARSRLDYLLEVREHGKKRNALKKRVQDLINNELKLQFFM